MRITGRAKLHVHNTAKAVLKPDYGILAVGDRHVRECNAVPGDSNQVTFEEEVR